MNDFSQTTHYVLSAAGQAICMYAGKTVLDHETGKAMLYNRKNLLNNWFLVK